MRCPEDYYWFYENWPLIAIIVSFILLSVFAYVFLHIIPKYRSSLNNYSISGERCPDCHSPVEATYIRCPECHYKLKANCPSCGKVVKTSWDICPYCEQELKK